MEERSRQRHESGVGGREGSITAAAGTSGSEANGEHECRVGGMGQPSGGQLGSQGCGEVAVAAARQASETSSSSRRWLKPPRIE